MPDLPAVVFVLLYAPEYESGHADFVGSTLERAKGAATVNNPGHEHKWEQNHTDSWICKNDYCEWWIQSFNLDDLSPLR